ncbi:MAG: polysaccharide biosynthesis/export family protein [Gemmatimonadaceae bacterium]
MHASKCSATAQHKQIGMKAARFLVVAALFSASLPAALHAQGDGGLLLTRADLELSAQKAELGATKGDYADRMKNASAAAAIRQRLRDGDIQVGDRIVVTITTDKPRADTVVVRSGRVLEIGGLMVVPVSGVLRSELQDRVAVEVRKYIKAERVEVTPLVRIAVLGAVMRPGYFVFAPDLTINDAIMGAGGPTPGADLQRSSVRRGAAEYRTKQETGDAFASGLTLDQFGMSAGDELIVGEHKQFSPTAMIGATGALASVLMLFVTMRRH